MQPDISPPPDVSAPDVSVVIAAYNAEATLDRAIASAIAQKDVRVEIIVVDDQSRDATLDVARAYPGDIVRVVALARNRGPGGARNAGLDVARGRCRISAPAASTGCPRGSTAH